MKKQTQGTQYNIAVDGVTTLIGYNDDPVILSVKFGVSQAIITVDAGAAVLGVASALISVTKDNASTVNVYVESNVIKVQNKTAAAVDVFTKNL